MGIHSDESRILNLCIYMYLFWGIIYFFINFLYYHLINGASEKKANPF